MFGSLGEDLRGDIAWRPTFLEEELGIVDRMGHAEIDQDWPEGVVAFSEHNIIEFNVTMEDSFRV